ncbi:hypothetical protein [Litchfieldia alkalitelluris]|uniref:hypothetical protein n=1 Tax=Litchfieldia alkalitelluris TaxID=304268 RepID=UPI000997F85A|nr:hypothetical protein [Litchfieldia alkalitelluris]
MSINEKLADLYSKWTTSDHFVSGGVVDEEKYHSSKVKVLMLLKEVNDPYQTENWSLVDLIQDQIQLKRNFPVWKRAGEWNYGLQHNWPYYVEASQNFAEGLSSIATTNLKKSGGTGESNMEDIMTHAKEQLDLWTQEIEIMKPDLVICGGTYSIVAELLALQNQVSPAGTNYGKALNTTFIDFYHPAYRISPKVLYAYFKETIHSIV